MESLETIFSSENEIVEKLKEYAYKLDYGKIFFALLGPELRKIFENKKNKVIIKNFLEGAQYEYGFFNTQIDLQKAFSIYKKYADLNDYLCMYKMHVIYLCEYDKFNVSLNRVLEKIYLLKCFAYLPNYVFDWDLKLFEKIDIKYELAEILDLEDNDLKKHKLFFELLYNQQEKYNLTENDINLMKGVFLCYFSIDEDDLDKNILNFSILNSVKPNNESDIAYYNAKNKCTYFKDFLKLDKIISDDEIENFYKEVKEKKLYDFYTDYGNYLLDKHITANQDIILLFTIASDNGYLFSCFRVYLCLLDYYDFDDIMSDFNKATVLLDYLLDEIVFEKILTNQFILLII